MKKYSNIFTGLRFYQTDPSGNTSEVSHSIRVAKNTLTNPEQIGVVIEQMDNADSALKLRSEFPDVHVLEFLAGGKFTPGLNGLLHTADAHGMEYILFASNGFAATSNHIGVLMRHMKDDTMVVGARLFGHNFAIGKHKNSFGDKCPWFTFALVRVAHVRGTGICLGGDSAVNLELAGSEEPLTFEVNQLLHGADNRKVKLVEVPGLAKTPNMENWSPQRIKNEKWKIKWKETRSKAHSKAADLGHGVTVWHVA